MRVAFAIHDPEIFDRDPELFNPLTTEVDPFTTKVELDVSENSAVTDVKREMIPKLLGQLPDYEFAPTFLMSMIKPSVPSVGKQLAEKFGIASVKFYENADVYDIQSIMTPSSYIIHPYHPLPHAETSVPYLSIPSFTYGKESCMTEVAKTFVSLMKCAKLDDGLSLSDQDVEDGSTLGLSLDIDFALSNLQCENCKSKMNLGHLYNPIGYPVGSRDIAAGFAAIDLGTYNPNYYTILDIVCPACGFGKEVWSLPPIVINVQRDIYFNLKACWRHSRDTQTHTKEYFEALKERISRRNDIMHSTIEDQLATMRKLLDSRKK
jgi:hypothetical protein